MHVAACPPNLNIIIPKAGRLVLIKETDNGQTTVNYLQICLICFISRIQPSADSNSESSAAAARHSKSKPA